MREAADPYQLLISYLSDGVLTKETAVTALCTGAGMATSYTEDFKAFCRYGLKLYGKE